MEATRSAIRERLCPALPAACDASRQGLRPRFPRRQREDAGAGDLLSVRLRGNEWKGLAPKGRQKSRGGDGLDLDEEILGGELGHLDQGARRPRAFAHEAVARAAISREILRVAHEDREFHDVTRRATDRGESQPEIAEDLIGLRLEVPFADELSLRIESDLAGDIDEASATHFR